MAVMTQLHKVEGDFEIDGQNHRVAFDRGAGTLTVHGVDMAGFESILDRLSAGKIHGVKLPSEARAPAQGSGGRIIDVPPGTSEDEAVKKAEEEKKAAAEKKKAEKKKAEEEVAKKAAEVAAKAEQEAKPEAVAEAGGGDLPPELAKAGKLLDVLNIASEKLKVPDDQLLAWCEKNKVHIPVLERIQAGTLAERVKRTVEIMRA